MVTSPPDGPDGHEIEMVGVDCSIIMNPKVWEASGHATGFKDPMVECAECKGRFRQDQVLVWRLITVPSLPRDGEWGFFDLVPHVQGQPQAPEVAVTEGESDESLVRRVRRVLGDDRAKLHRVAWKSPDMGVGYFFTSKKGTHWLPIYYRDLKVPLVVGSPCPRCGAPLGEPRSFNLMLKTHVGALEDEASVAYLRPETAQGIFANFKNVLDTTRVKVPFGIGQVGKSFRNEINPRNYTFRSREFEQMEIEFFCHGPLAGGDARPTDLEWYEFWRKVRYDWYVNLGLKSEKLRLRDQGADELAHYSKACADIEYLFPFSDEHQELEGVAHRGNFDLTQHAQSSGKDLTYFDDEAWERDRVKFGGDKDAEKKAKNEPPYRFLPTVIEPSAGADRAALAFLCEAYTEDQAPDEKGVMQTRVLMKFHPKLAPIKVAVFPLVNKEGMPDIAYAIYKDAKRHMTAFYDDKGAVGRRYRRQDEVGTPFCVTVDGQTLQDGSVTIRERDSLAQVRVGKDEVVSWLKGRLGADT
jgi:glycyl-tRNA synthetase